jgi:CO dehydrogenase maturation factor
VKTAERIQNLVKELNLDVAEYAIIINRVSGKDGEELKKYAEGLGLTVAAMIPQDQNIFDYDLQGKAICELPQDSPAVATLFSLLDTYNIP